MAKVKEPKQKTCPICEAKYLPRSSLQKVCHNYQCAIEFNKIRDAELAEKAVRQQERQRKETTQQERRSLKVRKLAVKPLSYFAKQAQTEFNAFIRERDADLPCISCGRFHDGQYHAGHYRTVGANPELRFNEDNCHRQCAPCNNHLSGNIENYTPAIRAKIGEQAYQLLMGAHEPMRYRREDFERIRDEYKAKRKALKQISEAA